MKRNLVMRLALGALLLLSVLAAGGCGGTKNVGTLANYSIVFSGFTPHIGMTFYLKLVDTTANSTVALSTPTAIAADGFSVTFPSVIQAGHVYHTDFWVDVDGNGLLDHSPNGTPAGVDHSWRITSTGSAAGIALTFPHDTNWVDITPY